MSTLRKHDKHSVSSKSQNESQFNQYKRGASKNENQNLLNNEYLLTSSQNNNEYSDERYYQLKKLYDERINSLYNNIKLIASKFDNDEILNTMKNDAISNEFIHQRLKEIVDEAMINEKEDILKKYNEEIADLRAKLVVKDQVVNDLKMKNNSMKEEYEVKLSQLQQIMNNDFQNYKIQENTTKSLHSELENLKKNYDVETKRITDESNNKCSKLNSELNKIKNDYNSLIDNFQKCEDKFKALISGNDEKIISLQKENNDYKLEFERLQKVISVLEIDYNNLENTLKEKITKADNLQIEMNNIQSQNFELSLKNKKLTEENKSLSSIVDQYETDRKNILEKYNTMTEEAQKAFDTKLASVEETYKEKTLLLKKKIIELKNVKTKLENFIETEKSNVINMKTTHSKKIIQMTEDMGLIKNEWERKCEEQEIYYKKAFDDLEAKLVGEINNLKNTHQLELEYKLKEINILKNETELLKNFEKEYMKISRHEEIVNNLKEEMKIKYSKELKSKEIELENIFKTRSTKFEEEKRIEYEFVNENLRKAVKKLEKTNEDTNKQLSEFEDKLMKEKEKNEKLFELNENLKKNVKIITTQNEEEQKSNKLLTEKINLYEIKLNNLTNSNYNYQENVNNLHNKLSYLEGEKMALTDNIKSKEENYKEEFENLERKFNEYKENQIEKYNEEYANHDNTKKMLIEVESSFKELQNEYTELSNKNNDLLQKISVFEELSHNLNNKAKSYETEVEKLDRKLKDSEKKFKRNLYESKTFNELLLKIFKTKVNGIKSEITNLKNMSLNEINSVKKEYSRKIEETLIPKIKLFFLNIEKQGEIKIKMVKEGLIKDFEKKYNLREEEYMSQMNQITQKFEKKLGELSRQNEKIEKDYVQLDEQYQDQLSINRENAYRIKEYEQEIKKIQIVNNNLHNEIENLSSLLEKVNQDKKYITKLKEETEEIEEKKNRELIQKYEASLAKILQSITKIKSKYQQEILILKNEVENMNIVFESKLIFKLDELQTTKEHYQRIVDGLDKIIIDEKENSKRLKNEIENKDAEFLNVRRELDRLGSIYENKIEVLNNKINSDKDKILDLKNEIRVKNEHFGEANSINNELKSQLKSLKVQLENKIDDINNLKREYEKLLIVKERRINELQGLINQSYISYNSGVNNIKIANKLDDEIKSMMKKLNIDKNSEEANVNKVINNNVNNQNNNIQNTNSGNNSDYKKKK